MPSCRTETRLPELGGEVKRRCKSRGQNGRAGKYLRSYHEKWKKKKAERD